MQYSPKLKTAMEEIKAVLKKHDIAAFILLHTPGFTEYLNKLDPTYSCAFLTADGEMRVRLKQAELPGGRDEAKKIAEDTYNMVTLLTDMLVIHAGGYMQFQDMLKKHWGGYNDGDATHTSHETQNN